MRNQDDRYKEYTQKKTNSINSMKNCHIFSFSQNVKNIYCHIIFDINEFLICFLKKTLHLRKKCPYSELFWSVFRPNERKYGPE